MDLLIIVNEDSDIVYSQGFNQADEIERCRLILLAYGSIDVINDLVHRTRDNYFDCIDSYIKHDISVFIFPSFYKAIFVHSRKKNTKKFLYEVHRIFKTMIINKMIKDFQIAQEFINERIEETYREMF
ncbi:hypothetical protein NGRA_0378 [Nosema granulosis]|uniref:Uncharacterized protein n=1 Tax=Nosema granulosis TaxID=83296 RepID=A0A9P6H1G9_9MICR|nr:hypothetical protein NGRA_0378 [Nosema granulosis]